MLSMKLPAELFWACATCLGFGAKAPFGQTKVAQANCKFRQTAHTLYFIKYSVLYFTWKLCRNSSGGTLVMSMIVARVLLQSSPWYNYKLPLCTFTNWVGYFYKLPLYYYKLGRQFVIVWFLDIAKSPQASFAFCAAGLRAFNNHLHVQKFFSWFIWIFHFKHFDEGLIIQKFIIRDESQYFFWLSINLI